MWIAQFVESPEDAFECFMKTDLDLLVLEIGH